MDRSLMKIRFENVMEIWMEKTCQNDAKIGKKWSQNDAKLVLLDQNDVLVYQNVVLVDQHRSGGGKSGDSA